MGEIRYISHHWSAFHWEESSAAHRIQIEDRTQYAEDVHGCGGSWIALVACSEE